MQPLFNIFSSLTKVNIHEYVSLEANITNNTFINKDGSYSTYFNIKGSATPMGDNEIINAINDIEGLLRGTMKKRGYRIEFVFEKNHEKSGLDIDPNIDPIVKNLPRIGLSDLAKVVESRKDAIIDKVMFERCYMVISTFPAVMNSKVLKEKTESRDNNLKEYGTGIKPGAFSQSNLGDIKELLNMHNAFCNVALKSLRNYLFIDVIDCHTALTVVMNQLENHHLSKGWKPSLLGDSIRPRMVSDNPNSLDQSHILNMDISQQLFTKIPQVSNEDSTAVKYGRYLYKPLMMDMPPSTLKPFSELFEAIDDDVPFRMSMVIESGHDDIKKKISSKKTWATLLAITNSTNKEIKKAAQEYLDLCEDNEVLASMKVTFCTWANDVNTLSTRSSMLTESVQSWGSGNLIEEIGDPIELWLNTIAGLSKNYISTAFPLILREAFYLSPISRPSSPWDGGAMLYRTIDKKLFPYQPMSSKQASFTDLYYAPPGSGKSFKLAADNLAFIVNPKNTMLPRIAMIDIGFSSGSFAEFIKSCLPDDKKDLVQSFKLEMTSGDNKNNINVFDTPLGCRKPISIDRAFLVNFLSMLFTPASDSAPPARIDEICGPLIDEMYEHLSDEKEPNPYQYGVVENVDEILIDLMGGVPEHMTWWQVVDMLFDRGYTGEAALAQRYAVPNLTDITTVITASKNIKSIFGKALTETGELLLDFIKMMTVSAVSDFPILAQPSSFDTGRARIVSLDLSSVTPKGKGAAAKKTGLMYMTARYVLCKDFYKDEAETLPQIPDKYVDYHRQELRKEAGVPKKIAMDEFHRTSDVQKVRDQVELDIREGRKYNVAIALLSQSLSDFDKEMVNLADNFYILSKGKTEEQVREIRDRFAPKEDSMELMKQYVTGPDPDEGTAMLYIGNLKGSRHSRVEQVIYLTISKLELWAYTTTREDYTLRKTLTEKVGLLPAMEILMKEFPSGSAKDAISSYKDTLENEADIANLNEVVSLKLINKYHGIE